MAGESEPGMGIIHSEFAGSTILVFLFILRSSSSSMTSTYAFFFYRNENDLFRVFVNVSP